MVMLHGQLAGKLPMHVDIPVWTPCRLPHVDLHMSSEPRILCRATAAAPVMGPLTSEALMRVRKGAR
jgi:hypothetical protein